MISKKYQKFYQSVKTNDNPQMKPLPRTFYSRDTITVARDLLGKKLVRKIGNKTISGIITETEAYRYQDDPASHAHKNMTDRNRAMFEQVGRAYVYFTYGMYYCVNAVARAKSYKAGAVLLRAIQPVDGISIMIKNRGTENLSKLADGPAKLAQALNITKAQYGEDLASQSRLFIAENSEITKFKKVIKGPRVGIKEGTDKLWNFRLDSNF